MAAAIDIDKLLLAFMKRGVQCAQFAVFVAFFSLEESSGVGRDDS